MTPNQKPVLTIKRDPAKAKRIISGYESGLVSLFQTFKRDAKQVLATSTELHTITPRIDALMKTAVTTPGHAVVSRYVSMAHNQGVNFAELRLSRMKRGKSLSVRHIPGRELADVKVPTTSMGMSFNVQDQRVLQILQTRNLAALKGITDETSKRIIGELSDGLMKGESSKELADRIGDVVDGIGVNRARAMARTESMYALNQAAISRYGQAGVENVEWLAGADGRCCDDCLEFNGQIFKIDEVPDLPYHVNCRCTVVPTFEEPSNEAPTEAPAEEPAPEFVPATTMDEVKDRVTSFITNEAAGTAFKPGVTLVKAPIENYNSMIQGLEDTIGSKELKVTEIVVKPSKIKNGSYTYSALKLDKTDQLMFNSNYMKDPKAVAALERQNFAASKARNLDMANQRLKISNLPQSAVDRIGKEIERIQGTVRWTVSTEADDPIYATVTHEGYHAVYFKQNLGDAWDAALKANGVTMNDKYAVSEYAATNIRELFAETGSAIKSGVHIPANVKKAFMEVVK